MATKVLCLNICHIFTNLTGCRQLNIFLATLHKALGPWSKWGAVHPLSGAISSVRKDTDQSQCASWQCWHGFHPGSFLVSWVSLLKKRKGLNRQGVAGHILWNQLLRWSVGRWQKCTQRDIASIRVGLHLLCPPGICVVPGDTGQEGKRRSWV